MGQGSVLIPGDVLKLLKYPPRWKADSRGNGLAYLHLKQLRSSKTPLPCWVLRFSCFPGQPYGARLDLRLQSSIVIRPRRVMGAVLSRFY